MKYSIHSRNDTVPAWTFDAENDNQLEEKISEFFSDTIWDALYLNKAQGFFPDAGVEVGIPMYAQAKNRLKNIVESYSLMRIDDSAQLELLPCLEKIIDERELSEQSSVDIGQCVISMLTQFLKEGHWHIGLKSRKSKTILLDPMEWPMFVKFGDDVVWRRGDDEFIPLIWFGLPNEAPITCWTIDKSSLQVECWKSFWFNHFGSFDWDILFNHEGDGYIIWMFTECGMDEPADEFELVKAACPICLNENDSRQEICGKLDDLFIKTYTEVIA